MTYLCMLVLFRHCRGSAGSFQIGNDGQQGTFQGPDPVEQIEGTGYVAIYVIT